MTKGSLVLGGRARDRGRCCCFHCVLGTRGGQKNNNACNADFGTHPHSFSQTGQPWERLIAWHTRAGRLSLWALGPSRSPAHGNYVRDDRNPSSFLGKAETHKHREWTFMLSCLARLEPLWIMLWLFPEGTASYSLLGAAHSWLLLIWVPIVFFL